MEMILNAIFIYVFILLLFRIAGKRTLSRLNSRDLILLVIISEATQQGMLMNDLSITGAFTVIATLVAMDMCTSWISKRWKLFDIIVNGTPTMIIKDGILMEKSLKKAQITIDDIREVAREERGLESVNDIKYAILEKDGKLSIIPKELSKY